MGRPKTWLLGKEATCMVVQAQPLSNDNAPRLPRPMKANAWHIAGSAAEEVGRRQYWACEAPNAALQGTSTE